MAPAFRWTLCCAFLLSLLLSFLGALPGPLPAPARADGSLLCLAGDRPVAGPCQVPEPIRFLPGAGAASMAVVANFGLLLPAPAGGAWQFICDDGYATAPPDQVWRGPGAGYLAASRGGLLRSDDGCDWAPVEGDAAGRAIEDLLIEPAPPGRIWALGSDPGTLYLSSDGGRRFATQAALAAALPSGRLRGAPSDPMRLYATAGLPGAPPGLWVSRDGGGSWQAQPPPVTLPGPLSVLAVAPDDDETVYFQVTEPEGDELWKSADGGKTLARVLKLSDFELLVGLAFGPVGPGGTRPALYVAGRAPIVVDGGPPGRLYLSRDGGGSWQPPVPSPKGGPSYRCLEFSAGKLFACAGGEAAGDAFLVGVSEDEGRSWTPVVRLADVHGPRACVRDRCVQTELWLCEGYGQCAASDGGVPDGHDAGTDAGMSDAGADRPAGPTDDEDDGGCGCALGGAPRPPAPLAVLLLALLAKFALSRRNKSPR